VSFIAYGLAFLASLAYLWPRTRSLAYDRLAGASVEVGVVFTGLTLVTGSIWGRPTWGTWWVWDPLLTTTALLFVLYVGYLVLRHVPGEPEQRARRSAIAAIVAFIDVPVVYFSVYWWQSLHQRPSIDNLATHKTTIHGSMAWTLLLGFISFTLAFGVLVVHRVRLARLEADEEDEGLELALAERRREVDQ
jgi:heme exporter protein C